MRTGMGASTGTGMVLYGGHLVVVAMMVDVAMVVVVVVVVVVGWGYSVNGEPCILERGSWPGSIANISNIVCDIGMVNIRVLLC